MLIKVEYFPRLMAMHNFPVLKWHWCHATHKLAVPPCSLCRYAASPLIVALSVGHSDITRFCPWSPVTTGNHWIAPKKFPKVAQTTGAVDVSHSRSGISGRTSWRASACPNLHE